MSINQVVIGGRLTSKPTVRVAGSSKVATFSLAVNDGYGEKEHTSFVDCQVWGKTAEFAEKYLDKGRLVAVIGRLQQDRWEKDGKNFSKLSVVGTTLEALEKKEDKDKNLDEEITPEMIPF